MQKRAAMEPVGGRPDPATTKTRKSGRNREFVIVTYVFLALFLLMIAYFVYFQFYRSESVINSSYNGRLDLYADYVTRGDIVSSEGEILATTETDEDGGESRVYPYGRMFAHVVGYFDNGKSGLESEYNFNLLRSHSFVLGRLADDLKGEKHEGDTLVTTLDIETQEAAYEALGERDGAVVVLEVETGKMLAMVSKPDYNPNTVGDVWDDLINDDEDSVLLNRATFGQYPPGSVFKIFTTLEYVHENSDYENYRYDCGGVLSVGDVSVHCYSGAVHGEETLMGSFANSCNTSYASIGLTLNSDKFKSLCESMLFNRSLPGDIPSAKSYFSLSSDASTEKIMHTAIGQGDTLVTPLHMALIAAAADNAGTVMTPYLAEKIENDQGITVRKYAAKTYGSVMSAADAALLREYMSEVVASGTASAMSGQSYNAAGKTGSAEYNSAGDSHGWFVGYGSKDGYEDIAIAVIVEDGGSGSSSAVPVAKRVFDVYFNQ